MHNGLLAIPFGLMIYWIASNDGKLTQLFRHRWLIHLGEISFAVYLLQTPIFLATKKIFSTLEIEAPYFMFFLGFTLLLISSHVTYLFIEKPLRLKIKNFKYNPPTKNKKDNA